MDRQMEEEKVRWMNRQIDSYFYRKINRLINEWLDKKMDVTQMDNKLDGQIPRWMNGQLDSYTLNIQEDTSLDHCDKDIKKNRQIYKNRKLVR